MFFLALYKLTWLTRFSGVTRSSNSHLSLLALGSNLLLAPLKQKSQSLWVSEVTLLRT